ncbi:hypothetical protein BC830DRAFT_1219886, partial [Chytriomyces sp. MP71]
MPINVEELLADIDTTIAEVGPSHEWSREGPTTFRHIPGPCVRDDLEHFYPVAPSIVRMARSKSDNHFNGRSLGFGQGAPLQFSNVNTNILRNYDGFGSVDEPRGLRSEMEHLKLQQIPANAWFDHDPYPQQISEYTASVDLLGSRQDDPVLSWRRSLSTVSTSRSSRRSNKPATRWSGRSSQRFPGKISDAIIDFACDLKHVMVPIDIVMAIVNMVKEFYKEPTNKGAGCAQAIMAIMFVCNLEDPALVRRSMEVLDLMVRHAGAVFTLNFSLNLDFYQHFIETRKHITWEEKMNITYLCGLFASWYTMDFPTEELAFFNMQDPTLKVKQFFEGLLRAGYEFPHGSLSSIPAEKMAANSIWSLMRGGYSFTS